MTTAVADEKTVVDFLPEIQKALDGAGNTHSIQDVVNRILNGQAQLWVEGDGMLVTEIEPYPQGPVLNFWIAAGVMGDVLTLAEQAYKWGREIGCVRAAMLGRKAWERVLEPHGWEPTPLRYYTKEL